jgi:hypothetical protein
LRHTAPQIIECAGTVSGTQAAAVTPRHRIGRFGEGARRWLLGGVDTASRPDYSWRSRTTLLETFCVAVQYRYW